MIRIKEVEASRRALKLSEYLPYRFSVVAEAMSRHLAKRYASPHGLKRPEWRVLHILSEGGTMTTQEVIARTSLDRLRVSRAAIRMEDRGLLARVTHPQDQRVHLLQLTPNGRRVFEDIAPVAGEVQDWLMSVLDPNERDALNSALAKLSQALTAAGDFEADRSDEQD